MASNKQLQAAIAAAALKLGVPNDPSGNNAQLTARLKLLEGQIITPGTPSTPLIGENSGLPLGDASPLKSDTPPVNGDVSQPPAGEVTPPVVDEVIKPTTPEVTHVDDADLELPPSEYLVATGKAISTKKGVISEGQPIFSRDFATPEAFSRAVSRGSVVLK